MLLYTMSNAINSEAGSKSNSSIAQNFITFTATRFSLYDIIDVNIFIQSLLFRNN